MRIQTMSCVVGTAACNAKCPFCISKQTGLPVGISNSGPYSSSLVHRNFKKACQLAKIGGVTTILLTGKGEPTLYPDQITEYVELLGEQEFPFVELQTNGLRLMDFTMTDLLKRWSHLLTTVIISVVSEKPEENRAIFTPDRTYIDLAATIDALHKMGYMVRLNCTMMKGYVDNYDRALDFVHFAKKNGVEQISLRPVKVLSHSQDAQIAQWTKNHALTKEQIDELKNFCAGYPKIMSLAHGAKVFDAHGVGVCLTDCITRCPEESDELRQIIFYPDGRLTYDWEYQGAVLLPGEHK